MMIEKSGTIRLRDIPTAAGLSPEATRSWRRAWCG